MKTKKNKLGPSGYINQGPDDPYPTVTPHQAEMELRKYNRARRPQPDMTKHRAMMFLEAWSTQEYARVKGVGPSKDLNHEQL